MSASQGTSPATERALEAYIKSLISHEMRPLTARVQEGEATNARLTTECRSLRKTVSSQAKTIETLQSTIRSHESAIVALQTDHDSLEAGTASTRNQVAALRVELARAKRDLAQHTEHAQNGLVAVKGELHQLSLRVDATDRALDGYVRTVVYPGFWGFVPTAGLDAYGGCHRWFRRVGGFNKRITRPPVVLPTLPFEVLEMIVRLLTGRKDRFNLARAKPVFLALVAKEIYMNAGLHEGNVGAFVKAKMWYASNDSVNLACIRDTERIFLKRRSLFGSPMSDYERLPQSPSPNTFLLNVQRLFVSVNDLPSDLGWLERLFSLINPEDVSFSRNQGTFPSTVSVSASAFNFAARWTRMDRASFFGAGTIPVLEGNPTELALHAVGQRHPSSYRVIKIMTTAPARTSRMTESGLETAMDVFTGMVRGMDELGIGLHVRWLERVVGEQSAAGQEGAASATSTEHATDGANAGSSRDAVGEQSVENGGSANAESDGGQEDASEDDAA